MTTERTGTGQDNPGKDRVTIDAMSLRGIAHPLRIRMLGLLRADGPSTATRLAARMGLSSGATSYHLRQLAAYGYVVEDPDRGAGRERWWRAAHRFTEFRVSEVGRDEPELTSAYLHAVAALYAERMRAAVDEWPTLPEQWQRAGMLSALYLRLTAEESARLVAELEEVIDRYRHDDPDRAAEAPPGSEPVIVQAQVFRRPGGMAPAVESEPGADR